MKIGVLGTGRVGNAIATRLAQGTLADAAQYGEVVFNFHVAVGPKPPG